MKTNQHWRLLAHSLSYFLLSTIPVYASPLIIHQAPLFLSNAQKANVLVILDDSNSMDEAANGSAVGSAAADSKSEIARKTIKSLIDSYTGKINMGLMAYQQSDVRFQQLHNAPYDVSFDPANYDPTFTGPRNSLTKRFRTKIKANPDDDQSLPRVPYVYYNIALPFYSSRNEGSQYCYSYTATFDVGPDNTDIYHCYSQKTTETDTLPVRSSDSGRGDTASTDAINAAGFGGANLYNNYYLMTDSDTAQNIVDFGRFMASTWVSSTWFSNSSPGGGFLHVPIKELDTSQTAALKLKLATSQFSSNGSTNPSLPLENAGLTPLEGTILTAKDYFTGDHSLPIDEGGKGSDVSLPLPESCGKNFVALLTDGLPSVSANGSLISDSAVALNAVKTATSALKSKGVETYMIGFALPTGTESTALDGIAEAGGTEKSYTAGNTQELETTFDTIFTDILNKTGASSSAATNSTSLSTNSHVYQARFNSGDWSGRLFAKALGLDMTVNTTPTWDAAEVLNSTAADARVIITYDRDNGKGIPFSWTYITAQTDTTEKDQLNINAQTGLSDSLGKDRVNFLRGGDGGSSAASFRTDRVGKLGDIIHSTPYYSGAPTAGYNDVEMPGYSTFHTDYANRTPVLYAGANDGMLHGFRTDSGKEVLAYVPKSVFGNLSKLTAKGYGHDVAHQYFVDGAPMVADAYVDGGWKTVLAGGLNAGGQGIYALNITDPDQFKEANAANIALWEFTDEDDHDLGYTFVQPADNLLTNQSAQIAKMANGKWAVIIGNGYNNTEDDGHTSSTGHAYLYILFIEDGMDGTWTAGTDYVKIDTGKGSIDTPNGLATPIPVDTDGDGNINIIYAGDLQGNLWKFDVSSSNMGQWGSSISDNNNSPTPLFTAKDSSGKVQPITSAPLVTRHPRGGYIVSFGTGQYLQISDLSTTDSQTIYGLWDNGTNIAGRSDLVEQSVIGTVHEDNTNDDYRITSANPVDYNSKRGWYIDLPESGERVDLNGVIRDQRFVFVTRTPSSAVCAAGGSSWLMDLDYLTGSRISMSPFDVNGDGLINDADFITTTIDGQQVVVPSTGYRSGSGGMVAVPTVVKTSKANREVKILANSRGSIKAIAESASTKYKGRVSWSELK